MMTEQNNKPGPQVAIFWTVNGKLILKGVGLHEAQRWGRFLNALAHQDYWAELQRRRAVPTDMEYDEPPRGRVVFDRIADRFYLYADLCLLADEKLIKGIIAELGLGDQRNEIAPDLHYRCAVCMRFTEDQD